MEATTGEQLFTKGVAPTLLTEGKACVHRWEPSHTLKAGGGGSSGSQDRLLKAWVALG